MAGIEDTLAWYLSQPTQASVAAEVGAGAAGAAGGLFGSLGSLAGAAVIPTFLNFVSNQIAQGKVDRQNSLMAQVALQNEGLAAGVPLEAWDVTNYEDVANTPAPEKRYDGTWTWNGQLYGTPLAAVTPPSATAVAGMPDPTADSWLGQVAQWFTGGDQALVFNPTAGTVGYSSTYPNSSTPTGSYVPVGPTVGGVQPGMTTGSNVLDMLILAGAQATGMGSPNVATPTAGDIIGGAAKDVIGKDILGTIQAGAQLAPVTVVKTQEEQAAEAKALEEEAKTKVIIDWLGTYGKNASDSFIRTTMEDNGISTADMAKATGAPLSDIQARYDKALPSTLAIDPTLTGKDTAAQVALDAAVAKAASDAAAAKIASDAAAAKIASDAASAAAAAKIASDAAAAKIASDAASAAKVPTTPAPTGSSTPITSKTITTSPTVSTPIVTAGLLDTPPAVAPVVPAAPTGSSTPIASKTITTTPKVSTPIVTGGLIDTPPAVAPVAPVVPAAPPAVAPRVNIDINNDGIVDAEQPVITPKVPATPPVVPVTPTPPPPPTSGGGLFSSPTRTTDLLFGDPYKYQRDKFTLLDNLLSYGRY
jgi:hypothetical protein